MRDTFNKMIGRTRYVVLRLFLHLGGGEVAPILGVLNSAGRDAIDVDGDLEVLGEGLVEISQTLLQYDEYWLSAANEGDVFFDEGEAGDYVNELFTDSAQRYLSEPSYSSDRSNEPLSIPVTQKLFSRRTTTVSCCPVWGISFIFGNVVDVLDFKVFRQV